METYKAGQQEKEQNAPDLSQQTPVTFPIVSPEAKRLCGDAVVAPLTNPQVWEHKSLEVAVKALPPLPPEGPTTMSSREIAELVEARHDNVKRTIETLAGRGVIVRPQSEDEPEKDAMGRTRITQVYRLGKRDSFVVVAQLSPEFTGRVVDRWQELEEQVAQPPAPSFALPKTFAEALRLSADLQKANEKLAEEKALLEQKTAVLTHVNGELAPKAAALEVISGEQGRSLGQFVRTLKGWPLRVCKMGRQTP